MTLSPVDPHTIPIVDDGAEHHLIVMLGDRKAVDLHAGETRQGALSR